MTLQDALFDLRVGHGVGNADKDVRKEQVVEVRLLSRTSALASL